MVFIGHLAPVIVMSLPVLGSSRGTAIGLSMEEPGGTAVAKLSSMFSVGKSFQGVDINFKS